MINNTYDYSELKNQVKTELKNAISEGGKEGLTEGLTEIMSKKLVAKKINFDTKELTEYIKDQIENAINNVEIDPKKVKNIGGIDLKSLVGLNDKELKKEIENLNTIFSNTSKKIDFKKLLGGILVAKDRGIDFSEIFNEDELNDFIKEFKIDANMITDILNEISKASPKNIKFFDTLIESVNELDKVKTKTKDFAGLYKDLLSFINNSDQARSKDFWDDLCNNIDNANEETKALIKSLGELKQINEGANNQGGIIGTDKTVLTRKVSDKTSPKGTIELKNKLDELAKSGVNVAQILDVIYDKESNLFLEVQKTAKGSPISTIGGEVEKINPDVFRATDEQIVKLISDLKKIYDSGVEADIENLSNVFYDLQKGFTIIDLDLHKEGALTSFTSFEDMLSSFIQTLRYNVEDINDILGSKIDSENFDKFTNKVENIAAEMANAVEKGYAKGQDSNSPSVDFENLEKDAVDGIQKGANESEEKLEEIGTQMAKKVKEGFENEILSDETELDLSDNFEVDEEELEEYKNALEDVSDILKALSSEPKDSKTYAKNKEGLEELKEDYYDIIELIEMLESGSSLDEVFASDKWKEFVLSLSEVGNFDKEIEDILDEQDALDENLQKQRKTVESKKEELQVQKEINNELNKDNLSPGATTLSSQINEITQAEDGMGNEAQKATDQARQGLAEMREEAEKTNEALERVVYHYGALDGAKKGSKSHTFGDEIHAYYSGNRNCGRGWADGTGTYVTSDPNQLKKSSKNDPFKKFYVIDTSKLKLYEAHIEEDAQAYYEFAHKLEQYCIKMGSGFQGFDENLKEIDPHVLYESVQKLFKDSALTFDEFNAFLNNMVALVKESGMAADGSVNASKMYQLKKKNGSDDIKTRFLKSLGFQGTNFSGTSYDTVQSGSVIFDIDEASIIKSGETINDVMVNIKDAVEEAEKLSQNGSFGLFEESSGQLAFVEGLNDVISKEEELQSKLDNTNKQISGQLSIFDILGKSLPEKLSNIKALYEEFEDIAYGGDEVYKDDRLEYFEKLRSALSSLTEEDLDQLDLGKKFSIDKFAGKLENTINDMETLSEEVFNLGDNDDWSDEYTVLEGVDNEYKNIYNSIKYVCEILDAAKIKTQKLGDLTEKTTVEDSEKKQSVDSKKEEIVAEKELLDIIKESTKEQKNNSEELQKTTEEQINKNNKLQESIKEQINENEKLKKSVEETSAVYQDDGKESVYRKKKAEIQSLLDEIELLNQAEKKRIPQYVDDVYNRKRNKYSGLSDEELSAKISEKQQEEVSSTVTNLNKKWASIIALMDEVKERQGEILDPKSFPNVSNEKFDELSSYYEKLSAHIHDDTSIDESNINLLREKSIELAKIRKELEEIIRTADPIDQLEYKLDNLIDSFSNKKGKFSRDSADQILSTLNQYDKATGQNYKIEDITDNEKIIVGVNKRLHELQEAQKQAEEAARKEAAAMEQQKTSEENVAQSITNTTAKIEEQTQAIKENSDATQQSNVGPQKTTTNIPASIITGFKDEQGVVSNVVGSEITSLESLKNQIVEVREAITKKTEEFELEGQVVDGVVEREKDSLYYLIATLEELKATIGTISTSFENISFDGLKNNLNNQNNISNNIDEEAKPLNSLNDKINEVRNSILDKNDAFELEEQIVANVVDKEKDDLYSLIATLEELKATVEIISDAFKLIGANNIKNIKISGLTSLSNFLNNESFDDKLIKKFINIDDFAKGLDAAFTKLYVDIDEFSKAVNSIDLKDNNILEQLSLILQKGEELKNLAKVIQSTKKELSNVGLSKNNNNNNNSQELLKTLNKFNEEKIKLESAIDEQKYVNNKGFIDRLYTLRDAIESIDENDVDQLKKGIKDINSLLNSEDAKNAKVGLVSKITNLQKAVARSMSNTKLSSGLRKQYQALASQLDQMFEGKINYTAADISRVRQELEKLDQQMISTGQTGKSFLDRVGNQITIFNTKIIAQYLSIHDLIRYVRQMFETIRELDTALVDLRKTTTMSASDLEQFYSISNDIARNMGVTTSEIIQQAANWSRLGYASKEAAASMAELSSQFAAISPGMDVNTATDGLVSAMKAFHVEVDSVEKDLMDPINRLGNTMATTNEEIVQMLERSSAAMYEANNSINETLALESAAVQITRNAETTGTAFRTIAMRIRGLDEETEELSEDFENIAGDIAEFTKTASKPGGITLFTDASKTTYKSTYQLLKDISKVYDDLTDKQQANLLEKLAGKRGGQVLAGIIGNFSEVERAMDELEKSAGSADKEMEIIRDSFDYKLNDIKESWVGFLQDLLGRKEVKELLDALLNGSESLQKTLTTLTPIITGIVKTLSDLLNIISNINDATHGLFSGILGGIIIFKTFQKAISSFGVISDIFKNFTGVDESSESAGMLKEEVALAGEEMISATTEAGTIFNTSVGESGTQFVASIGEAGTGLVASAEKASAILASGETGAAAEMVEGGGVAAGEMAEGAAVAGGELATGGTESGGTLVAAGAETGAEVVTATTEAGAILVESGAVTGSEIATGGAASSASSVAAGAASAASAAGTAATVTAASSGTSILAALGSKLAAIGSALASIWPVLIVIGTVAGVVFYKWYTSAEQVCKRHKELRDELNETYNSLKDEAAQTQEISSSLEDLIEQYKYAEEGSEEYYNIANKIAELSPDLVIGYTDEGNAILKNVNALEQEANAWKNVAKRKKDAARKQAQANIGDLLQSYNEIEKEYKEAEKINFRKENSYNKRINELVDELKNENGFLDHDKFKEEVLKRGYGTVTKAFEGGEEELVLFADTDIPNYESAHDYMSDMAEYSKELAETNEQIHDYYIDILDSIDDSNERTVESNKSLQNIRNIIIAYADEAKISAGQLKNIYEEAFNNDDFINIINDYYSLDFSDMPYEEAVSTIHEFINAIIGSSVFSEEDRNALLEALGFNNLFNKKQTFLKRYYADTDKRYYTADKEAKKFIDENQQLTSKDYDILNSLDYRNALREYQKSLNKATLSAEDYLKVLEQIKDTSEKIEKIDFAPYSKSGVINSITDNLTKGFDKLDEVYADVLDGEGFDFAKLATKDFDESFDGLKGSYEEFIETVSSNPESIEATQEAFDKLATSYIEQSEILQHLTEDNKEVAISMLEVRGVANAEEFVNDRLAKSKRDVALENEYIEGQNKRLVDSTMEEISAFVEENNKSEETRQELARLALQKQLANGEILNFDSDISNLKMFVEAIGGSIDVLAKFETAKAKLNGLNAVDRGYESTLSSEQAKAEAEHQFQEAQKDLREYLNSFLNKGNVNVKYSGAEKTKAALDKANKSASESREILDWIEVALQRVTESITRLGKIVSATYRNWSTRNNAIVSEMNEVRKQIGLQTSAYQAYLEAAEKIPLAENYKRLIREGGFFSEEINDKDLKKRIDEYKELYNKAIQAKDAIEDLNAQMAQLAKQKFDNVASEYDGYLADIEQRVNYINNVLSNVELRNKIAGKSFYQALMEQEQNHSSKLKSELSSLANALQDALSSGAIEYGSEEFNNMKSKIYEVENAIQESTNKIEEFKQKMKEVAKLDFDNIAQQFDNAINLITGKTDFAQNIIDVIEASGHVASIKFYEAMIDGANAQIESNKKKLSGLQDKLAEAMASGDIEKYDDQWYEMNEAVEETKKSIIEAASSVVEFANAMQQVEWDLFDRAQKGFSTLNDEAEYFIEMFKYNDIFEKESGALTEYGLATQGLYVQKYQTYKNAARKYADEIQKINDQLANDPTNTTLLDRYDDLLHSFWDATKAAEEEKEAIKDLVSDGFEILSSSIADIIDKYKEALQSKKDLYDYENDIEEQTGNINSIQKQLLAYQGDNSEETRATIQKLSSDLIKAQKQLEETEYEKYISDQEKLLDDFADSLEEWINERLDNVDKLLEDAINATNNNSSSISNTITNEANLNCGIITNEMRGIWNEEEGLMSVNNDILYSTDSTCSDISSKIDSLPTSDLFSFYISDLNSSIISELSSVENVSREINYAISDTRYVLDNIKSVVEEFTYNYSSVIDNLGRNVVDAINAKQLSVSVHVDGYNSYSDTSGGGGPGYDPSPTPTPTPVQPVRYKVTNMSGTYDSAAQANAAARAEIERQLTAYKNSIHIPDTSARNAMIQRKKDELTQKYQVVRAKKGALITSDASNIFDALAKSIGEDHMVAAKEGERILTEEQNRNFEKLANNGFEPIDEELQKKFTKLSSTFNSDKIDNFIDKIGKIDMPNASQPINNNSVQTNVGDVNINLPNVTNKQEFVSWLRNDGQIEKIIQTMTIGKMAGGNSYDKLRI